MQFVGNYKNWVFAQPFNDWCLVSFKAALGLHEGLIGMGLVTDAGGGPFPVLGGGLSVVLFRIEIFGKSTSSHFRSNTREITPGIF